MARLWGKTELSKSGGETVIEWMIELMQKCGEPRRCQKTGEMLH